ncbi:glycosyltransferase [Mycolicibacterium tusciae]|uniref:glycosyltransferase n=1 Tax=Mycolicibacterium tusciae TaxID=75922 RepID=UPI0004874213|nr:glycosyltransferase [Mycolicibacterium tusciae]
MNAWHRADAAVIAHPAQHETACRTAPAAKLLPPQNPSLARSWAGLADLPTIVATGPFDDASDAEQLTDAFIAVRRHCTAQLVLLGTGRQRTAIVRRTFAHGVGADVHAPRSMPAARWSDFVAAADVVVPSTATGSASLLEVLAVGRAVVTPLDPATVHLVVPNSVGLVYPPGDVSAMAAALLRVLTSPALRLGMASRACEVARRHHLVAATSRRRERICVTPSGD